MRSLKFVKDPGYVYDLLFGFIFHYNKEYCMNNLLNQNKQKEEEEYFTNVHNQFSCETDELLPFFYLKDGTSCFMTDTFFKAYAEKFDAGYHFEFVQTVISDHANFVANLIEYYFPNISKEKANEALTSLTAVAELIRTSSFHDALKNSMYLFFINPDRVFNILIDELNAKNRLLTRYYEQHQKQITEAMDSFNIEAVENRLSNLEESSVDISSFQQVMVTFCLLNKNVILCLLSDKVVNLVLGFDYYNSIEYLYTKTRLPDLVDPGNAFSEKNRVLIMDMMLRKGEITIKDIEGELNYTGTNAYYHVTLLSRAKLIKTRNVGRTIFYSLNRENVDIVLEALGKYSLKYLNINNNKR